ncbi:MAG: FAD-binding protein [Bacteroidetes bacterium GWF2_49_14]|nr:MAG: FAD-binding protein [Bacteroidetes bacterium GWF2_49_14]HBB91781.1 FAD-binding oxidoreductase [Bacteroidales bacterium]
MPIPFDKLKSSLKGEVLLDIVTRIAYATDASVYRELPMAVVYPADAEDIRTLIRFAAEYQASLIPRTAGTSLAGQVVGPGIVVDVSRYMNRILELDVANKTVWVEPGVILDELNALLSKSGLFFGPETSTGNRCMIGGMLGNNACGLHSIIYGSTRDHTLAVEAILSDGTSARFSALSVAEFEQKCNGDLLENKIYREISEILADPVNQREIRDGYPDPSVPRRNTGYALDLLLETDPFVHNGKAFNLCRILGGSEGTLTFFTSINLNLVEVPPPYKALICAHFNNLVESIDANLVVLKHAPTAVELMDRVVLECTKSNHSQMSNRFFLDGEPETILIIEFTTGTQEELDTRINETIADLRGQDMGYSYPVVYGQDMKKVWNLRKAGLGLLANIPGDAKPVAIIEDTAIPVARQTEFIIEMEALFRSLNMACVYHAHVGTGELHLRPVLNLKDPVDVVRFRQIANETVRIVKKYRGSFSGEHGDGRLRASFIPELLGEHNYGLIKRIKRVFDPQGILNPGKITDAPPMDSFLRTEPGVPTPDVDTFYDFSTDLGIVRSIEKCNGSGDCRKPHTMGGTMCPSYQATLDEKNSTRARANILREFIYQGNGKQRFDHKEMYDILDLCLSCKACKSECPSSVDMAKLKGEFLQHWHDLHGIPFRTWLIANLPALYRISRPFAGVVNYFLTNRVTSGLFKSLTGFHRSRSIPLLSTITVRRWASKSLRILPSGTNLNRQVYLFIDEFTEYQDAKIGIKAIELLTGLGYQVLIGPRTLSARTYISKGFLRKAKDLIRKNILIYGSVITSEIPLVGIEPSAILGFRDEYPDLAGPDLREDALVLGRNCLMIEEFLENEIKAGRIPQSAFVSTKKSILLHGHCQQKAVSSTSSTLFVLNYAANYSCSEIPSGCCGMAGAFGYEKEHYDLSVKVGEMVLFPTVRSAASDAVICAPGTSCRHHIKDSTGVKALHPVEILWDALSR